MELLCSTTLKTIRSLSPASKKKALQKALKAFTIFCEQNFGFTLYAYQRRIAEAVLSSIIVEPKDVFVKISRQAGKTEVVTLLVRFLIIFYRVWTNDPLMCAIASPKGEQAKTDLDRLKKSISELRNEWAIEDREFNAQTIRAYVANELHAEVYKFSLAPTTDNESKTLNLLIVEEAHKADDQKRSDQLDPMLASTGGFTVFIGVGTTRQCDFKRGCDGELGGVAIIVPVDEVISDRRKKYEQTNDPKHLEYEKAFERELHKKGRQNPEIRRNFYLEDTVEEGNFVSRERLLSCARPAGQTPPTGTLFLGVDWARESDFTWATIVNDQNEVIDWFKYPHGLYHSQVEMMNRDLKEKGYFDRIVAVRGDDTGPGGAMEILQMNSGLPVSAESFVKFTMQANDQLFVNFEQAIFKEPGEPGRFSYPADHPLTAEFEEQMTNLLREYLGQGEYLSASAPEVPGAHDDACDSTALALLAAQGGTIGEILFG